MPDLSAIRCVACGGQGYAIIINDNTSGRETVRCDTCKLIYVVPQWTEEIANYTFSHYQGWPEGISGGAPNRSRGMRFIVRQIATRLPSGGSLLDVGCADGKFFNIMRQEAAHWQFFGAEPDTKWQGLDYQDAQVTFHPLRDCQFQDHQFDAVTILDALYYIPDPDKELAEIARILKPGGILVFDIAGLAYLQLRGLVGTLLGLDRTRTFAAYPFYYSAQAISELLAKTGFVVSAKLVDQGVEHRSFILRLGVSIYMSLIKVIQRIFSVGFDLSPKVVYIAHRR
jgi:SAM-dependent methyltransferase